MDGVFKKIFTQDEEFDLCLGKVSEKLEREVIKVIKRLGYRERGGREGKGERGSK